MASFKALCLAGVASLVAMASSVTAQAADLPMAPPPVILPPPVPVVFSGFYLRGDVGVAVQQLSGARSTCTNDANLRVPCEQTVPNFSREDVNLKDALIVGAGAGYQFNNWFRADVTGEYHTRSRYTAHENYTSSPNCPTGSGYYCLDGYSGSVSSAVFLVNGYVQLGTWYRVTPYVGAGVGASVNMFSDLVDVGITNAGAFGQAADRTDTKLAYALMAGFSYDLTPNLKLDFGYRYLDQGRVTSNAIVCTNGCTNEIQSYRLTSNDVRLGLRYVFANVAPPLPIVAKY